MKRYMWIGLVVVILIALVVLWGVKDFERDVGLSPTESSTPTPIPTPSLPPSPTPTASSRPGIGSNICYYIEEGLEGRMHILNLDLKAPGNPDFGDIPGATVLEVVEGAVERSVGAIINPPLVCCVIAGEIAVEGALVVCGKGWLW